MSKHPLSHYAPVFANKPWADNGGYMSYYRPAGKTVKKTPQGVRQWGRHRGLYRRSVETALNEALETDAARIYKRLCQLEELDLSGRITWSQFLLSQAVRTPTFIRYETAMRRFYGVTTAPPEDRVGCRDCGDLACVTSRRWLFLLAHEDDFFIRSDNPVLLSGFVERRQTCLVYPLTPGLCFVATAMPEGWRCEHPPPDTTPESRVCMLAKGGAWWVNFYLVRSARKTIIVPPGLDGDVADTMFGDVLGLYPQPPFPLHSPGPAEMEDAFESIRLIMSSVDGMPYPQWLPFELETHFSDDRNGHGASAPMDRP